MESSLRARLEKWAFELGQLELEEGAIEMLDLLWPVIAAAQEIADDKEATRFALWKALAELEDKLETQ